MENAGLELSAKFALMPNCLGHCGTDWFAGVFGRYLAGKAKNGELKAELEQFTAHHSYLKLIGDCNRRDAFDEKVVEAMWLGNELLENVGKKDLQKMMLTRFVNAGMQKERAKKLAENVPEGAVPHHSFHVLYVGSISGKIMPTLLNAEKCLIRSGRVIAVQGSHAELECWSLTGRRLEESLLSVNGIRPERALEKGEKVALHWGMACTKISEQQEKALITYTKRNLEAVRTLSRAVDAVGSTYSTNL
ncbi:MAG: DUF6390 family protein [Candidatus Burarchaeum sp.]|nr:DUF6390 family protein [Candidatus Burarchaeum sp.]MDO8339574.1 DUF6390 family protein [Candidatus Burarchaeum sp.]